MGEGLKLVNDIFQRAVEQHETPLAAYLGMAGAVLVLSDPSNRDLWERMVGYCEEWNTEWQEHLEDLWLRGHSHYCSFLTKKGVGCLGLYGNCRYVVPYPEILCEKEVVHANQS